MKISFFKFKVFCLFCLIIFKLNLCFSTNKSCTANSPESWIECGSKLKNNQIDTIEITDSILCNPNVNCNLFISNLKRVKIFTNNKSLLSRSGFFQNDFLSFQGIDELILLNLSLDEPQNSPFQEKSGMEEINLSCTESQFGFSELAQSNIQCGSLISVRSSKSVLLDSLQVSNSKQFGFIIHDNLRVILKSSKISNSWLFGIWGGKNKELIFENNSRV